MSAQSNGRKRKVKCPVCGRQVSLTSYGFLRVHKREHWSGIGLYAECEASRWTPSAWRPK
jgi:hypothetical protein